MVSWTYGVGVAMAYATATAFFYLGHALGKRRVQGPHRTAWSAFRLWWYAIGTESVVSGTLSLLAGFGLIDHRVYAAFIYLNLGLLAAGIFGLVYFLLFVFTGRRHLFVPVAALYVVYYVDLLYLVTYGDPSGLNVGRWRANLVFADRAGPLPILLSRVLGQWVPIVVGLAFASIAFRTRDRTQRWRSALVAAGVVLWAVNQVIAAMLRLAPPDWYQFANRSVGLLAALLVFLAYFPPVVFRERFRLDTLEDEPPEELRTGRGVRA